MFMAAVGYRPDLAVTVHRDQDQERPLYGALEKGCRYIEFDVHLKGGELLVGHDAGEVGKTFESTYLEPLSKLAAVHALEGEFTLIVDVKTKAKETFAAIQGRLAGYAAVLTQYDREAGLVKKSIRIIISGNRDKKAITEANPRLAFYDGRLGDLSKRIDSNVMPLVSDKWAKIVKHKRSLVTDIADRVELAAEAGIAFRPWAMPEQERVWIALAPLVEWGFVYNTDRPGDLVAFLTSTL